MCSHSKYSVVAIDDFVLKV